MLLSDILYDVGYIQMTKHKLFLSSFDNEEDIKILYHSSSV